MWLTWTKVRERTKTITSSTWEAIWNNKLYSDVYKKHVEGIKAALQILTGIAFAIYLIYRTVRTVGDESLKTSADHALKVVGAALAISAVIELVYTFFTRGPDEATDPLILGISSFALFKLSARNAHLNVETAIPVTLLAIAIVALFFARRFLSGMQDRNEPLTQDTTGADGPRAND